MRNVLLFLSACLAALTATADDRTLTVGEYWTDDGHDGRTTVAIGADGLMQFELDASALAEGLHTLRYRACDSEGCYSAVQSWMFYRATAVPDGTNTLEYWVDDNQHSTVAVTDSVCAVVVDGASLSEGLHTLHYQVRGSNGLDSPVQSWMFYRDRLASDLARTVTVCQYWPDNNLDLAQTTNVDGGEVQFAFDASALSEGLHTLHYRLADDQGRYGPAQAWLFCRAAPVYESGRRTLEYWIDDGPHATRSADDAQAGFAIDGSALSEGLHTLSYFVSEEGGRRSPLQRWMFCRMVPQATRISWVRYWWNNHTDKAVQASVGDNDGECVFAARIIVPDYAKTDGWSSDRVARLHVVFGDDLGHVSATEWADVTYPETTFLAGDANGDGRINISDVTAVVNHINHVESPLFDEQQADANGDGRINIADITTIINLINQKQ